MKPQSGPPNPRQRKKKRKKKRRSPRRRAPRRRATELRAHKKRSAHTEFVGLFSLRSLSTLPLPLILDVEPAPSPKRHFRSCYRPHTRKRIQQLFAWLKAHSNRPPSLFEVGFHLIDFEPLRPLLLDLTMKPSIRGEIPFDPLSLLLVCLWKISANLHWTTVASQLAHPENGALWRALCGFSDHDTPAASTLRSFRHELPDGFLNHVLKLFLATLQRNGLLPPTEKTHGHIIVGDGQLHHACSRHRCHHASASCFEETSPEKPRPCPAHIETKGKYSCACDTPACRERCMLAPRLDPKAGFIIYSRRVKKQSQQTIVIIDEAVWGFRSMAARLVDERLHCAWNVHTDLLPANADEGAHFPTHFESAYDNLPEKKVGFALYDSACGEQPCLDAVYDRGGIPLFDIQRDPSDNDAKKCKERGYDNHGHLLCHMGFPMTYEGIDYSRPRARWTCHHSCRKSEQGEVPKCPYLDKKRGERRYLVRAFPNGSYRLARLVPHGSKSWKKRTRWRNTAEGRNSSLQSKGLLRFPDYGLHHGTFLVVGADLIENLCTLARLVYEATLLDDGFQPLADAKPSRRIFMIHPAPKPSSKEKAPEEMTHLA